MNVSDKNITFITVTFNSRKVINQCFYNLPNSSRKIVIENSRNDIFIKYLKNKYKNLTIIKPEINLGVGAGINLALNLTKTKYAFFLSPDAIIDKKSLKEMKKAIIKLNNNFNLLAPITNRNLIISNKIEKVKQVLGHAVFFNLNKKVNYFFDENIFMFTEEIDLCKRIIDSGGKIYKVNNASVVHLGKQSTKYSQKIEILRNWHYMWSLFYFNKKHHNYTYALIKISYYIWKYSFEFFLSILLLKKQKFLLNKFRLYGIFSSIFGKKSFLRINDI
jgi:N-acetylglucosaminyl-diphospho-decaprenol L-rhamnosyltransferase